MNKIIIDMPTPELTKAVKEKVEEIFPDIPVEGYEDDEYSDKGLSRSDFIDKEYT
tara:strand:- start:244 stop:408 length:165 start_codon:yes stop_codon:yes gene_type:complete